MVAAADEDTALEVDVVPGQMGDASLLLPVLDRTLRRVGQIDEVVADKAFDSDQLRCDCIDRDVNPNVPLKANRDPQQWAWDKQGYAQRNRVERLFAKAKQFRCIATRYEKLKATFLGFLPSLASFVYEGLPTSTRPRTS